MPEETGAGSACFPAPFFRAAALERKRIEEGWRGSIQSWRRIMGRNVTISIGGLILLIIIVAIIF